MTATTAPYNPSHASFLPKACPTRLHWGPAQKSPISSNWTHLDFATGLVADVTVAQARPGLTQLDPNNMQRRLVNGECKPIYPHQYIRTNTSSRSSRLPTGSRLVGQAPGYEGLSGPPARVSTTCSHRNQFPDVPAGRTSGPDNTTATPRARLRHIKVDAVINWINGYNSTRTATRRTGDLRHEFSSVSVARSWQQRASR